MFRISVRSIGGPVERRIGLDGQADSTVERVENRGSGAGVQRRNPRSDY